MYRNNVDTYRKFTRRLRCSSMRTVPDCSSPNSMQLSYKESAIQNVLPSFVQQGIIGTLTIRFLVNSVYVWAILSLNDISLFSHFTSAFLYLSAFTVGDPLSLKYGCSNKRSQLYCALNGASHMVVNLRCKIFAPFIAPRLTTAASKKKKSESKIKK